jgi:DNA repair protein RecN (Recombination protein N)
MLTRLSIRDVVLIDLLELDFGPGLGVLTGETGAGKSILLDALGLALGMRADSALVRAGQSQAAVSVSFDVVPDHPALALLDENGLAREPGEPLVIRRIVKADGGSRAFVNDQAVSAGLLRELGASLVEIHGQHDDRGLLNPRGHRALLDGFGRIDTATVAAAWLDVQAAGARLAEARAAHEAGERDRDWLAHAVAELDQAAPEAGEEESLAGARAAMQAGARLGDDLTVIMALLQGSEGSLAQLRQAARRLDRIAPEHAALAEALSALDRAVIEAAEGEDALEKARLALTYDPQRLEEAEARLFDLRALARKHRVEAGALPALRRELRDKLDALEAGGTQLAVLEAGVAAARVAYDAAAAALTDARTAAAARLDAAVAQELAPLKLGEARFRTMFAPAEPGAAGGELSRFILALKVALAEEGGATTMIFDEIDRGVGGAVASAIGERLHRLAAAGQVLVVTHSPQVAARGATHLLIEKSHDGLVTRTGVIQLDASRRREEIARMLSGAEITDEARAQAGRLLEPA